MRNAAEKILMIGAHLPVVSDQLIVRVNDMLLNGNDEVQTAGHSTGRLPILAILGWHQGQYA
jgi:hypothetical protein